MGVRTGSYGTIWEVKDKGNYTDVRLSTSHKNKQTDTYEQDFGGYVRFIGEAHRKASSLQERDRIKFGDIEITNNYNKEKNITYTNVACFSFEMADESGKSGGEAAKKTSKKKIEEAVEEDDPF